MEDEVRVLQQLLQRRLRRQAALQAPAAGALQFRRIEQDLDARLPGQTLQGLGQGLGRQVQRARPTTSGRV